MNGSSYVFEINAANINEIIKKTVKTPLLLLCWAERFQTSVGYRQLLINITNKFAGKLLLGLINVEIEQQLAMYLQLNEVPELKLIVKGSVVNELSGVQTEPEILDFLKKYAKIEVNAQEKASALDEIKKKIINFELDGIELALADLAKKDKNNDKILIELVKYYLLKGETAKADETAQNIVDSEIKFLMDALDFWKLRDEALKLNDESAAATDDYDIRLISALNKIIVKNDFSTALDVLLELVAKNKNYKEQLARKAIVSIFTILGQSKMVETYRNKLYNLIF